MGGKKKKTKPSTFEEIYAATRREWPTGIKPYTRVFKDGRKEQENGRLTKEEQNELVMYSPFVDNLRERGYTDNEILEIIQNS